jgi:hypothetical protein
MGYLKQDEVKRSKAKKPTGKKQDAAKKPVVTGPDVPTPALQHDINHVAGLGDIQDSLDSIAQSLGRLTNDEHNVHITTGDGTGPVKLTLADSDEDDAMDRVISAFERIADSLAKLAGLSRPRLERWYEQEEYEPRYKSISCDGGAPGPAATDGGGSKS